MKPVPPELIALFNKRQYAKCSLFTLALVGGTTVRYTDFDRSITFDGDTYSAGGSAGPYFNLNGENSKAHWKAGLEVDTFQISVAPGTGTIGGVSFFNAIRMGLLDGADVTIDRLYAESPEEMASNATAKITIFNGRMVGADPAGASKFTLSINSWVELFNMNFPRNLWQSNCVNTLGDTACGVNLSALGVNGSVLTGSTANSINATLSQLTDYFTSGKLQFTSGANNGFTRGVRKYVNGPTSTITMLGPFPNVPAIGDTFTIYPGCDKMIGTCFNRFDNLSRFRGMPFIPENSSAV